MVASGPNSKITCRQAPQGEQATPWSLVTATASISIFGPSSATAEKMAVRSAQLVIPYEAFSTLQPLKICPLVRRMAAPTRKFEYGAWAFFMTFLAVCSSFARTAEDDVFLCVGNRVLKVLVHRANALCGIVRNCKPWLQVAA